MFESAEQDFLQIAQSAFELDDERRAAILATLHDWIASHAVVHPNVSVQTPSRTAQIDRFNKSLTSLCADGGMEIIPHADGSLEITPGNGEAESTLILLKRGTPWFEGCHDVEQLIASAIF